MTVRSLPLVALVGLLGCGGGAANDSAGRANAPLQPTTRDSAGVVIYEHPGDAIDRAPAIMIDTVPVMVIGGDAVDDDVSAVGVLAILSDNRVAGFDVAAGAVRIFGSDGVQLAAFGRRGEGPGEFRAVEQLILMPGDRLLVADWVARRATLVHPDSGIGRLEAIPSRGYRQSFVVAGVLSGGEWLMVPTSARLLHRSAGPEPDTTRQPMPLGAYRPGSGAESFDTVVVQYAPALVRFNQRSNGTTELVEGPQRFSGWPIAGAWNGAAVAIPNDAWRIQAYDAAGRLTTVVRFARPRTPVTAGMKDSIVATQLEQFRQALAERPEMARFENVEDAEFNARNASWADSLPPFSRVIPSSGRLLWLSEGTQLSRTDSSRSLAIDPAGRLIGRLTLPGDSRLMAISDDRVILRREDADGIVRFMVHRLVVPQ